ncbi:MAG: hypothetical protein V9G23_02455 [Giesbergeria sp.]
MNASTLTRSQIPATKFGNASSSLASLPLKWIEHDLDGWSAHISMPSTATSRPRLSNASVSFTDPQTGDPIEDGEAVERLRAYVRVFQNEKKPYYVKTAGLQPIIARLYEVRKAATHHFPLAIMAAGPNLPEDFHLGNMRDEGEPLLALCREALAVVKQVQAEINA